MVFSYAGSMRFRISLMRRKQYIFLALLWLIGLLLGACLAICADPPFTSLMYSAMESPVSIVRLLAVTVLPFLLSAFAVYFHVSRLVFPICFLKAFSLGFCTAGVAISFGNAGWLVRWLLFFTAFSSAPVLLWFFQKCLEGNSGQIWRHFGCACACVAVIAGVDCCVVSPFAATLLSL